MTASNDETFVADQIGPPRRRYWISRDAPCWTFAFDEMTAEGNWQPGWDTVERWFFEVLRYPPEHSSSPLTWRSAALGEVVDLIGLQPQFDGKTVRLGATPESADREDEAREALRILAGKVVRHIFRPDRRQIVIEFSDGTRLFADADGPVDLSIT